MDVQLIIVAIIVLLAVLFVGRIFWRKAKAFAPKGNCGADCGCETKEKTAK